MVVLCILRNGVCEMVEVERGLAVVIRELPLCLPVSDVSDAIDE